MATAKLILQQAYKPNPNKDNGNKIKKVLNPLETRIYCFLVLDHDRFIKVKTQYKVFPERWDFLGLGKLPGFESFFSLLYGFASYLWGYELRHIPAHELFCTLIAMHLGKGFIGKGDNPLFIANNEAVVYLIQE